MKMKSLGCGINYIKNLNSLLSPRNFQIEAKRCYPEDKKRFYKNVSVAGTQNCYEVNLDHRKLKTPSGNVLQIPNYPLALAVATEWESVEDKIKPAWMHLTGLSFTVTDNPQHLTKPDIVTKILEYLPTDTLLFKEESKAELLKLQETEWDPITNWFNERFDTDVQPCQDLFALDVSSDIREKLRKYFLSYNFWAVSGALYGVEAIKSVILTAASLERRLSTSEAVKLSLLEAKWQTEYWGNVEWGHDEDKYELLSRFSAAILFAHLNSSEYSLKEKSVR